MKSIEQKQREQFEIESAIAKLAKSRVLNPTEAIQVKSFLQTAIDDFDSPLRAVAKKILENRILDGLRAIGLAECFPLDCFVNYSEKSTRAYHGAFRKPFHLENGFSIDLVGSSNEEYPLRIVLVFNRDFDDWSNSVCLACLHEFKIGHSKLFTVFEKYNASKLSDIITDAENTARFLIDQIDDAEKLNPVLVRDPATLQLRPMRNFRKWVRC